MKHSKQSSLFGIKLTENINVLRIKNRQLVLQRATERVHSKHFVCVTIEIVQPSLSSELRYNHLRFHCHSCLQGTYNYRFYSVQRQTILLVNGKPLGSESYPYLTLLHPVVLVAQHFFLCFSSVFN